LDGEIVAAARNSIIKEALLNKVSRDRILKEINGMLGNHTTIYSADIYLPGDDAKSTICRPALALLLMNRLNIFDIVFLVPTNEVFSLVSPQSGYESSSSSSSSSRSSSNYDHATSVAQILLTWQNISLTTISWLNVILSLSIDNVLGDETVWDTVSAKKLLEPKDKLGCERFLFWTAAIIGLDGIACEAGTARKRALSLTQVVVKEGLRADNETCKCVGILIDAVHSLRNLSFEATREKAGICLRNCRGMWRGALALACAHELATTGIASSSPTSAFDPIFVAAITGHNFGSTEGSLITDAFISERHVQDTISRYRRLKQQILEWRLDEVWLLKPLLNGNALAESVGLKKGPLIGVVCEEQIRWQLRNPHGTLEECIDHLKEFTTKNA